VSSPQVGSPDSIRGPDGRWVISRRRVSLAGRVARSEGATASAGVVHLTMEALSAQPAVSTIAATSPSLALPRSRRSAAAFKGSEATAVVAMTVADSWFVETPISPDGYYFYLDLPPGDYLISGRDERGLPLHGRAVTVPVPDRLRLPPLLAFDLVVQPRLSAVRGSS